MLTVRTIAAVVCGCVLTATLAACSSGSSEPASTQVPPSTAPSTAPSTDSDEQALTQLAQDLWAARVEAGRTSDPDRTRFEDILVPQLTEREVAELEQYESLGVTREGAPAVTDIEPEVDGDTATVRMCLNEAKWPGYEKGRLIEGETAATKPFGFTAERRDGGWIITIFLKSADIGAKTTC